MAYQLDHDGRMERERLRDLESLFDPITIERLDKLGVDEGWQCLELGAGGGSIVEWLCQRVGKWGRVVAADLQTKFLETIDASNLEIRQHDVRTDPLETSAYDLIHARALVEHLPERDELIGKLVAALKPGGRLLIESGDYASFFSVEGDPNGLFERAWSRFFDVLVAAGFDLYYGRRLGSAPSRWTEGRSVRRSCAGMGWYTPGDGYLVVPVSTLPGQDRSGRSPQPK